MPRDLAAEHLDSLYLTDDRGRLTGINQWDGGQAPRFHLVRSPAGNCWRFRADLSEDLVRSLERLCRAEPVAGNLRADPVLAAGCLDLLGREMPVRVTWRGPAYVFPPVDSPPPDPDVVAVTAANAHLLTRWLPDWLPDVDHRQPFLVAVEDGAAVAVCASVRITSAVHAAGVETHPAFRRRGMGRRVVRAWSGAVLRQGATPLYSTSWENVASRGVAAGLGLSLMAADFHVT